MSDDLISVVDFAREHGARKQTIFEIVKLLGMEPGKRSSSANRGQVTSYLNVEDGRRIAEYLKSKSMPNDDGESDTLGDEQSRCVFYLLLLEPDHDPGRFKVGIADIFLSGYASIVVPPHAQGSQDLAVQMIVGKDRNRLRRRRVREGADRGLSHTVD
jgi:hypothetical protein